MYQENPGLLGEVLQSPSVIQNIMGDYEGQYSISVSPNLKSEGLFCVGIVVDRSGYEFPKNLYIDRYDFEDPEVIPIVVKVYPKHEN